ncbi:MULTISPECIES: GMC family oxidoreductase [unclassified Methylophaga]|jgi:choline dehydrogenase-like flavoprotein|uniref:GMC oxidoreductase n=1 Tax=unclassified Methylophaga TaxID=2629249 RepID=UPI000C8AFD05|nr:MULTISPECIES: GMC family oxidoreductase [unclassified Methylophaga]MAK67302.1 GMC family oxidoreductase [Methylophaga sp.]MAY18339.1 GMC family oxidoreductase [Methylophaga sp.]HCD05806.1 GMC family oxidoreductase [Methylophaga sp.]|tara:strand:- start:53848 stop:55302 length:1455 start_codon:yes stop_codon:yes gene_type:complete
MIINFNEYSNASERSYDFCICGAGAAGITLALELANKGYIIALFEGGDKEYSQQSQDIYAGEVTDTNPYWLDLFRLRFLGGTTNHWAGRCRPFVKFDFEDKIINGLPGWPISFDEINQFLPKAIEVLELEKDNTFKPAEGTKINSENFIPDIYASSNVKFRDKFLNELNKHSNIDLFVNANLVDIRLKNDFKTVDSITIQNYRNHQQGFSARKFIIAMGAIENARILLNSNSQIAEGIGNQTRMVGKCFMEHFNIRLGEFVSNKAEWGEIEAMQFMTSPNFAKEMNTGLSNITFGTVSQIKTYGRTAELKALFNKLSCKFGLSESLQFLYRHDCIGEGIISTLFEQFPNKKSQLSLIDEKDNLGLNRLKLNWELSEADEHSIRTTAIAIAEDFANSNLGRVKLNSFITNHDEKIEISHHSHQMGTTRMSSSKQYGVVDENCRVHDTENLYVAGSSVFATGGGGNPTMPLLQLTYRLADHLTSFE